MEKVKTLFIGTSEFAVGVLQAMLEMEFLDIVGAISQPDKPVGRKQVLTPPPVKQFILDNNLDIVCHQPKSIRKSSDEILETFSPELIIVASYGQIIPEKILNYPKHKVLNVHVSLLPDLRGAVPMPMAILKGYKETGVSVQIMEKDLDTGDVIGESKFELVGDETTETLTEKSIKYSAMLLAEILPKWFAGEITPVPQDESKATYTYQNDISKEKAEIKYETDVELAERMVRAFYPWPVAWITLKGGKYSDKRLKIFKASIADASFLDNTDGTELKLVKNDKKLILQLQNGELVLEEVQLEGKERRKGGEYLWLID